MAIQNDTIQAKWLTVKGAAIYSGFSRVTIHTLISKDLIRSSKVVLPGNTHGRRLVDRESLDSFIEAGVQS